MKNNPLHQFPVGTRPLLTTEGLAVALAMRPQSIRKRLSQTGAYFGLRPFKLPNGRLLWPPNSVEILAKGLAQ